MKNHKLIFLIIIISQMTVSQTVLVDFAQPDTVNNMIGFIHGMSSTQPADSLIQKLRPAYWRAGTLTNDIYNRATIIHKAKYILVVSDYYGYPQNNPLWIPPYEDTAHYNQFIDSLTALTSGLKLIYEPWNEPDGENFWKGTETELFETFARAERGIRKNLGNDIEVLGPSLANIDTAYIRRFCNYCLTNNVRLDYLSWHWFFNDVSLYLIEDALKWATAEFVKNPAYAPLQIKGVIINEMTSSTQYYQPAHYLANLYYMEKGKALGALHACWDLNDGSGSSNCWNNTLDGLLTPSFSQPHAVWWAAKCYSETVEKRVVSVSSSPEIVSFAANNQFSAKELNVLVAHYARSGYTPTVNVSLQLENLSSTGFIISGDSIQIIVYKIPNDSIAAVSSLGIVSQNSIHYTGQSVVCPLPSLPIKEAYWISIKKKSLTAIQDHSLPSPIVYSLKQNYPNPFNPMTTIHFSIPKSSNIVLSIYDLLGRKIETLVNTRLSAGAFEVQWNANNFSGGVYFYRIEAGEFFDSKKLLLLK